jgi:hypothetical protein
MTKKSALIVLLVVLSVSLAWSQDARTLQGVGGTVPVAKPNVPASKNMTLDNQKMNAVQEQMALEEARAWLKQLGYDLTIEQVINLKSLSAVGGTQERAAALTAENMRHLRVLKNLETLELVHYATDDWVANAAGLTKMRSFVMGPASYLTDRSAEVFAKWPELIQLMIHGCKITDAGLAKLAGLKKLERLGLQYAPIGDASMPIIGQNTELENLNLSFTKVTDAGLPHLYNLQKLTYLSLQSQTLTPAAVATLRQKLPNCKVVYP